jgi:uncharacterized membrane protein YhaH (DUF805 family)
MSVFISYRRQTAAGEARALFNDLVGRLGRGAVFMDVDSISLGRDFRGELQKTLSACDSMLVVIDKDWAAAKDEKGQIRLENAGDFVRMEIEAGLKRDIAVTPVLVKGAQMPAADELPAEIRDLAYRNGFELSHNRWESDVREMIRRLGLDAPGQGGQVETDRRPIAPGEAGGGSVPVDAKPRQESRPLAFVQAAGAERADTAETTSPPSSSTNSEVARPDEFWSKFLFSFKGRISRKSYWLGNLGLQSLQVLAFAAVAALGKDTNEIEGKLIYTLATLTLLWPILALALKRLHDFGQGSAFFWPVATLYILSIGLDISNGMLALTSTIAQFTVLIVLGCVKGMPGPNEYGDDPLENKNSRPLAVGRGDRPGA